MLSRYGTHFYLVEVSGTLLFVAQCAETVEPNGHDYVYETYKFRVWELDVIKGEAKEIEILGDGAIFLGCNASISIDSSKFAGVKPNRVYFTDTWRELFSHLGGGGRDMGVYSLHDGKVRSFFNGISVSPICPSTWVIPSFYYQKGITLPSITCISDYKFQD